MNSCIYRGTIRHRRWQPVEHAFTFSLYMMYLDLAELATVFERRWLWSARRAAPAWFRRDDYLGTGDLDEAVRSEAHRLTGHRPEGPVRVLTHLRYYGFVMNPVSFYYCYAKGGGRVETILAEITNTPWNERHTYALRASEEDDPASITHRFAKAFHISPFMPMAQEYRWAFNEPGSRLMVDMSNLTESGAVFDATLRLTREEISGRSLARVLLTHPWMTARVAGGIYWQALKLWLKRTPYFEHPSKGIA